MWVSELLMLTFDYLLVLHLMAELSNPFLLLRTGLKIIGKKHTKLYEINEIVFASVFLILRVILTPLVLIPLYEGDNILAVDKLGTSIIFYIQLFWAYKILFNIGDKLK